MSKKSSLKTKLIYIYTKIEINYKSEETSRKKSKNTKKVNRLTIYVFPLVFSIGFFIIDVCKEIGDMSQRWGTCGYYVQGQFISYILNSQTQWM